MMTTPLSWLLFLAVFCGIQQLSQCGVIVAHQRDLIWTEEKSDEVSSIAKRHDRSAKSNVTNETTAETDAQNATISFNETLAKSNETHGFEDTIQNAFGNKTDGLNLNTSSIDEKVANTSQEERERQTRSNGDKKPCRAQLLSYNPISFTSHEFDKEYNPPPVKQPPTLAKSYPTGNYKPIPANNQEGQDKKYSGSPIVQHQHYQNYLRPSDLNYPSGVSIPVKPVPQGVKTKSYPLTSPYPVGDQAPSTASDPGRPKVKPLGYRQGNHPVHHNENKAAYRAKPAEVQRAYGKYSPPGTVQKYLPKPQYPVVVVDNIANEKRQPQRYQSQNNGGVVQYGQGGPLNQPKPNPYSQNGPRKYSSDGPVVRTPPFAEEKKVLPPGGYKHGPGQPPGEKYGAPFYERPSYNSQNSNHANRGQEKQYAEDRVPQHQVSYATEQKYLSEKENTPSSYPLRHDKDDSSASEDSYESDGGKSYLGKKYIPLRQYLADKEASYKSEHGYHDSSENKSNAPGSYSKDGQYDTANSKKKSPSKCSKKGKKSCKNFREKPEKSLNTNPYVSLYQSKDTSEYRRKKPNNSTASCKKPKALQEIVLPKGGFILEGEYVLQRKSGKGASGDYDKHEHCPDYPHIIDRITIRKGGFIHKGRYTLDRDESELYNDDSDYKLERAKKEVGEGDEDDDIEITIPFRIAPDEDDDDGVHILRPREIGNEMFEGEELEDKTVQKRQLKPPKLPIVNVPVDLNLVDPLLKGVGKVTAGANKIKLKIKHKEIQRQVSQAVKNLHYVNQGHREKLERLKDDLKKKLEASPVQKTSLINRDAGNNGRTLSTTFNFNSPAFPGLLGSPILRKLRASKPILPENLLKKSLLPLRFAESDEIAEPFLLRRQSVEPRAYEDDDEDEARPYARSRSLKSKRARSQYGDDDDGEPRRFNLLEPASLPVKVTYRSRPAATCPIESHRQRSQSQYYDDGRTNELTDYEMSLMPLVRSGIHKVKSLVFDAPEAYPSRRLRTPVVYEDRAPQKVSRAVFNEDGYWYEQDLTEIAKVQRPREIIYSDVIFSSDPENEDYYDYRRN